MAAGVGAGGFPVSLRGAQRLPWPDTPAAMPGGAWFLGLDRLAGAEGEKLAAAILDETERLFAAAEQDATPASASPQFDRFLLSYLASPTHRSRRLAAIVRAARPVSLRSPTLVRSSRPKPASAGEVNGIPVRPKLL